jgi:hypothetical protein
MPEHVQYEDDDLFNPETHHEESDVPLKPLWWALILFVVFAAITHVVLYFMYQTMVKAETKRWDPPQTAVERPANADVPQNQPLLQPFPVVPATETTATVTVPYQHTPVTDLKAMRAAEERVLKHYGWVDKQNGIVHIPIDQAKDMLVIQVNSQVLRNAGVPPAGPAASSPPPPGAVTLQTETTVSPAPPATTTGGAH